ARNDVPAVRVPDEDDVAHVFVEQHIDDILDVCVQTDVRRREMGALAESSECHGIDGLARLTENGHHELVPGPGTTPRAMHDHKCSHTRTPNMRFSTGYRSACL